MAEHHVVVDRGDSGGMGAGLILGVMAVVLLAVVAFFVIFGNVGRPAAGGQTNVNAPTQSQPAPQAAPQSGPNINIPPQVDVNVNQRSQPPAQQPAN